MTLAYLSNYDKENLLELQNASSDTPHVKMQQEDIFCCLT